MSFFYVFAQNHTVYWRSNGCIAEICLCTAHGLLLSLITFKGFVVIKQSRVVFIVAYESFFVEFFYSFQICCLIVEFAFCAGEVCFCACQFAFEICAVKFGNNLSFFHNTVIIHINLADNTAHLCADFYFVYRFYCAGCRNGGADCGRFHFRCFVNDVEFAFVFP